MTTIARAARAAAALLGAAVLVLTAAGPAHATPPPAPVTDLAATLGAHGVVLSWTASGAGTALVRDVTGLAPGYAPADGRAVAADGTQAYDTAFTNLETRTYAVWATESDGTTSASATELVVDPLAKLATVTTIAPLPTWVLAGKTLTVTGTITRGGLPLPGVKVQLRTLVAGGTTESPAVTVTSGVDGSLTAAYTPLRTRTYRWLFVGDAFSTGSASASRAVQLQPRMVTTLKPATIAWKQSTVVGGTVAPNLAGRVVTVQRWYDGAYHAVAHRTLTSASTWSLTTAPYVGKHGYRAVLPGEVGFLPAVSPGVVLTVTPRTLSQGLSGPDVLVMEKRLAALHYDIGRVGSYFGYDARHAVTAFQKVQGLPRTGRWGAAERARAAAPQSFHLRYHDDRLTAEVDITRQVLVLAQSGKVLRVVDISTGSEKTYYVDGIAYVAHTPRGVYSIFHKIDGVRVSRLGELYRPSYFYKGWAIHGSGSVPTYPASHGCVRVTNPAADRLFSLLKIGTRVAVYDE